jgi:hypothetical protein
MTESDLPASKVLTMSSLQAKSFRSCWHNLHANLFRLTAVVSLDPGYTKKRKKWVQKLNMIWFKADWILAQSPHLDRLLKDGPGSRNMAPSEARS